MRIWFDARIHAFHNAHYDALRAMTRKRGHVITDENPDFLITADEAYNTNELNAPNAKVVWIGHSFDAKGACLNNKEALQRLEQNADYLFVYSSFYKEWLSEKVRRPIHIVGMPRLDALFHGESLKNIHILYAPTFNAELNSESIVPIGDLEKYGKVIVRKHPAFFSQETSVEDELRRATIVISDYSSVGMEAIVLGIPTILVNNPRRNTYHSFPPEEYITNISRKAAICVDTPEQVIMAVKQYIANRYHFSTLREKYGKMLCAYQGVSAEKAITTLEEIYAGRTV